MQNLKATFEVSGQERLDILGMQDVKGPRPDEQKLVQIVSRLVVLRDRTQER